LSKHNIGRFFYNEEYREVQTETRTILHLGDFKLSPQERVDLQRMLDCKNACEGIEDPSVVPELISVLSKVNAMIESGVLVRDVSRDLDPDWALRMLELVTTLKRASNVLERAEGKKESA
jgi:hypothetical protein